jgi:cleavage and polyadenylation specificity factor subunit 1
LNDDGISAEERQMELEETENAKIKRQVEADLGGFDIEQEWVEEIERENCFKIDTDLGGAPPIQKSAYSVWIVDASNGWMVVDSYELEEFEHAMTMQVMSLSEVRFVSFFFRRTGKFSIQLSYHFALSVQGGTWERQR